MMHSRLIRATLLLIVAVFSGGVVGVQSAQSQTPALPPNAIPARAVADPSVQVGWQRYDMGAAPALSLILPEAPGVTVETVQGQLINTYVAAGNLAVYAAVRIDGLPTNLEQASEEKRSGYFRSFFQGFSQGFQKGLGPTNKDTLQLLDVTLVATATGRRGYQQRLTLGTAQGRAQMVFVGTSAFGIVALWFPNASAQDQELFFNSFRVK